VNRGHQIVSSGEALDDLAVNGLAADAGEEKAPRPRDPIEGNRARATSI
jgi:hypothetical protein